MGRKIKPLGLHRHTVSLTLPLDVIGWLDRLVVSKEGASRSRIVEAILRSSMDKGQTTLKQFYTYWECSGCSYSWRTKDRELDYVWCPKCTKQNGQENRLQRQ